MHFSLHDCIVIPSIQPTQVWLDGAAAYLVGPEDGVVRLHPNHEQPKNAATKYDNGWLLYFRPAATAASQPAARAAFTRFIDVAARPLDHLAAGHAPAPAPTPAAMTAPVSAPAAAASAGNPWHQPLQQAPAGRATGEAAGGSEAPPTAPMAASASGVCGTDYDPLVARPGESDEAFAQRLGRIFSSFEAARQGGASGGTSGRSDGSVPPREAAAAVTAANLPEPRGAVAGASGPPARAPAAQAGEAAGGGGGADEDDVCVICMTNPRQIGFLHGSSVHRCVCAECALLVSVGAPCPLCRAPIAAVLNVY